MRRVDLAMGVGFAFDLCCIFVVGKRESMLLSRTLEVMISVAGKRECEAKQQHRVRSIAGKQDLLLASIQFGLMQNAVCFHAAQEYPTEGSRKLLPTLNLALPQAHRAIFLLSK